MHRLFHELPLTVIAFFCGQDREAARLVARTKAEAKAQMRLETAEMLYHRGGNTLEVFEMAGLADLFEATDAKAENQWMEDRQRTDSAEMLDAEIQHTLAQAYAAWSDTQAFKRLFEAVLEQDMDQLAGPVELTEQHRGWLRRYAGAYAEYTSALKRARAHPDDPSAQPGRFGDWLRLEESDPRFEGMLTEILSAAYSRTFRFADASFAFRALLADAFLAIRDRLHYDEDHRSLEREIAHRFLYPCNGLWRFNADEMAFLAHFEGA